MAAKDKIDEMMTEARKPAPSGKVVGLSSREGWRRVKIVAGVHYEGETGVVALRDSVIEVTQHTATAMVDNLNCAYYTDEPLNLIEPPKAQG